jgi:hypothetical protein
MEWIQMAQDMVQWLAVVNTLIEATGFIQSGKYLEQMSDYQIIKDDSVECISLR